MGELAARIRRLRRPLLLLYLDIQPRRRHVARARRHDDPHIAIKRLRADGRTQNPQQVKIRQEIHHPRHLDALLRLDPLPARRHHGRRAQHNHVQPPRRRVVDPPRRELPHAVQVRQVDLLRVHHVVARARAQVIDVFD
jgi:hypothetical protein